MKRIALVLTVVVAAALLRCAPPAIAQAREPYRPLVNGEMAQQGLWETWAAEFNAMTGRQKAEAIRRHMKMCLESFEMTDEQRALVRGFIAKHVTDEAYAETDPEKRQALQFAIGQDAARAEVVLGRELYARVFFAKPPIAVLIAVKNDPAFK